MREKSPPRYIEELRARSRRRVNTQIGNTSEKNRRPIHGLSRGVFDQHHLLWAGELQRLARTPTLSYSVTGRACYL